MGPPPPAPARLTRPYKCALSGPALAKAQEELHEDPAQRASHITALQAWIASQPHLRCRTDAHACIATLRGAKFSQLRAQQMVENGLRAMTDAPEWFSDIDPFEKRQSDIITKGYCIPLPKKMKNGCQVLLYRIAAIPPDPKRYSFSATIRSAILAAMYTSMEENNQVNGIVMVFDYTGATMKHLNMAKLEELKKWHRIWQRNVPGRVKGLHFYNVGSMFEVLSALVKPFLDKKYQERFHVHATTESLLAAIGEECMPEEYLPDEYEGPTIGSTQQAIDRFKSDVQTKEMKELFLYMTNPYWRIDESKRPQSKVQASFRKLAID